MELRLSFDMHGLLVVGAWPDGLSFRIGARPVGLSIEVGARPDGLSVEVEARPDGLAVPLLPEGPSFDGPFAVADLLLGSPVGFGLPFGLPGLVGLPFGCRVGFGVPYGCRFWPGLPLGWPFGLPFGLPGLCGFALGVLAVGLPVFDLPVGMGTTGLPGVLGGPLGLSPGFLPSALPHGFALAETRVHDLPTGPSST